MINLTSSLLSEGAVGGALGSITTGRGRIAGHLTNLENESETAFEKTGKDCAAFRYRSPAGAMTSRAHGSAEG